MADRQAFHRRKKINYPVVMGTLELAKPFGVEALPVTLLIDRHGRIADVHGGMVDKAAFQKEKEAVLEEGAIVKH